MECWERMGVEDGWIKGCLDVGGWVLFILPAATIPSIFCGRCFGSALCNLSGYNVNKGGLRFQTEMPSELTFDQRSLVLNPRRDMKGTLNGVKTPNTSMTAHAFLTASPAPHYDIFPSQC